jgi:outer membrane protein assembly factor BamB
VKQDDEARVERPAEVDREYGPFPGVERVNGVTFDGTNVWFAGGNQLQSFDPDTGQPVASVAVRADAGTAFDGRHLFQLNGDLISKVDPRSGEVVATLPAPGQPPRGGLTWAEGFLWVAAHSDGKLHQIDAETGRLLRTLSCAKFVTGVTWADGDIWHGTWQGGRSDLRRIDPTSGEELERLTMPAGAGVSGVESDGAGRLFVGGGSDRKVRAVRIPRGSRGAAR